MSKIASGSFPEHRERDSLEKNILIIAGEASGDLHGSTLAQQIHRHYPGLHIWGIGGDRLQACGTELLYHVNELGFLGISEVIAHLPFILQVRQKIRAEIKQRRPVAAILIDYPGFNLRIARELKKAGVGVFYYIAPQVWAWGRGRIRKMAQVIDQLAVILPFEQRFFKKAGIKAEFVGHPLLDILDVDWSREQFFDAQHLDPKKKTLILLPGSRNQEVTKLLPDMLASARRVRQNYPNLQVLLSCAPTIERELLLKYSQNYPFVSIVSDHTYAAIHYSDAALVASGTATLETACLGTPMAIVYRTHPLTFQLAREFISVKNISLVNIIAGHQIVPEFIQHQFEPARVADALTELIYNSKRRQVIQSELEQVKNQLGKPGAAEKAALLFIRKFLS